jgi:hypothetical protein
MATPLGNRIMNQEEPQDPFLVKSRATVITDFVAYFGSFTIFPKLIGASIHDISDSSLTLIPINPDQVEKIYKVLNDNLGYGESRLHQERPEEIFLIHDPLFPIVMNRA